MSGNLIRCQNGHLFSSRRYGTVCPYCNIETATKEKKSVEKSQEEIEDILFLEEENPVCGWIVCVKGPRRGKDYRVMDGKNFVGRADDMDIQILGDNKIARRNHAVIVFDAKKRENMILPGLVDAKAQNARVARLVLPSGFSVQSRVMELGEV